MPRPHLPPLTTRQCAEGVLAGERSVLGRALTLVESTLEEDRRQAEELLQALLGHSGRSRRLGISGVPGVGKSTFIDSLGERLIEAAHKVAVLAVDPSSSISGGSILGDKTRMQRLATHPHAFVRPTPSGLQQGGVGARTREAMIIVEAAGYDIVIVETLGVGQTEIAVADMVDCYVSLLLAGGGDELQGIKRGFLELVDLVIVNKADGENLERARRAQAEYQQALDLLRPPTAEGWQPRVLTCSARDGTGIAEVWEALEEHWRLLTRRDGLTSLRNRQLLAWMRSLLDERVRHRLAHDPRVLGLRQRLEGAVLDRAITPQHAAEQLFTALLGAARPG